MRIHYLFIFISITFFNCKLPKNKKISEQEIKKEVNYILDDWHKNASNTNFEKYFETMEENSIFIGTDATENWNKPAFMEFSKPFFDKGKAWHFTSLKRNVYISNHKNVIWFDELLDTQMGICRGSGVLEKTDGKWKLKHYVLSLTVPNNDAKKIINIKKEKDSVLIINLKNNLK